jgi:hypothetical protein
MPHTRATPRTSAMTFRLVSEEKSRRTAQNFTGVLLAMMIY